MMDSITRAHWENMRSQDSNLGFVALNDMLGAHHHCQSHLKSRITPTRIAIALCHFVLSQRLAHHTASV
jgi:hypothetical protein